MSSTTRIALMAGFLAVAAGSAHANVVSFTFLDGATPVGTGNFTYSQTNPDGTVGVGDLTAFNLSAGGQSYNLNFLTSVANANINFDYDSINNVFIATSNGPIPPGDPAGGLVAILSAFDVEGGLIVAGFDFADGQDVSEGGASQNGNCSIFAADSTACGVDSSYSSVSYGNVPEPATVALFAAGLAGFGLLRRRQLMTA